jgi:signal peptidase I
VELLFAQAEKPSAGYRELIDSLARTPLSQVVIFVLVCTVLRLALYPYLAKTVPHKRTGGYTAAKIANESLDAIVYAGVFVFMLIRPFLVQAFLIPSGSMIPTLLENDFIVANKAIYRYSDPQRGDIVVFRPPTFATTPDQRDKGGEPKVDFIKRCTGVPGDLIEIHDGNLFRNGVAEPDVNKHFTNGTVNDLKSVSTSGYMPNFKIVLYQGPTYKDWSGKYIPVVTDPHSGRMPNYQTNSISHEYAVGDDDTDSCFPSWASGRPLTSDEQKVIDYLREAKPSPIPKGFYLMMGDNRDGSFDGRAWGLVTRDDIIGRSEAIWLPLNRWSRTR